MEEESQNEKEGVRGLDIFQSCATGTELNCWTGLSTLFRRRQNSSKNEVEPVVVMAESEQETKQTRRIGDLEEKETPTTMVDDQAIRKETHPDTIPEETPVWTYQEKERLRRIFNLLAKELSTETLNDVGETSQDSEESKDADQDERNDRITGRQEPSSKIFLLELAKAAAKISLEEKEQELDRPIDSENNEGQAHNTMNTFRDDPEAAIQMLIRVAKQREVYQKRHREHLDQLEFILSSDNQHLLEFLSPCLEPLATHLAKGEKSQDDKDREKFSVLSVLLGKCNSLTTLQFLWKVLQPGDPSSGPNNNDSHSVAGDIYNSIIHLSFHCSVAYSFLISRDAKHRAKIRALMKDCSAGNSTRESRKQEESSNPVIQHLVKSLWVYRGNLKEQKSIGTGTIHGMLPSQEVFINWHDSQVPRLMFSLSILVRELLFPSLEEDGNDAVALLSGGGGVRQGPLLPLLHRDEASRNLLFDNDNYFSSWLFPIACTIPLQSHVQVGSSVRPLQIVSYRMHCFRRQ